MTPPSISQPEDHGRKILRARLVLPISRHPIENGAMAVRDGKIEWVGNWPELTTTSEDIIHDLGETVLLPGLVNTHCHLDYTSMAGMFPSSPSSFVDWVGLITSSKGGLIYSDYAESWLSGAAMLLKSGTTTVGDIEMVPELIPDIWSATPLRMISFLEMTGVKSRRPPAEILEEALVKIRGVKHPRNRIGLSPHAPYSTTPELLKFSADAAKDKNLRVTTHVSESPEELEMFLEGKGKMFTWISRSGRPMDDCGSLTPVQHLWKQGLLGPNFLAVHANYLTEADVQLLATSGSSVVHCPRSHAYFRHRKFPYDELSHAGTNICLGTDSLASVLKTSRAIPELDMFEEMRQFHTANKDVAPETILRMATINGARALGMSGQVGELSPGSAADLIALPFAGDSSTVHEAILNHREGVSFSMIDGEWAILDKVACGMSPKTSLP